MNRLYVRSLLISAVACLPMLAAANVAIPDDIVVTAQEGVVNDFSADPNLEPIEDIRPDPTPYSVSLQEASKSPATQRLNWRAQKVDIRFDLLRADTLDQLSLTLAAKPLSGVDPDVPLIVQFNGGQPFEISTNGKSVNQTIELPPNRARQSGNVLTISHATRCDVAWGGYEVDLGASRLDMGVMPRQTALQLRELEALFTSPIFAPKRVGLVSGGPSQTKLQALAAQAVGLRMQTIPEFRLSSGESDLDIIMVTRDQLTAYTDDEALLSGAGPQISLSTSDPDRVYLTGDTYDEVLEAVSSFAKSYLPASRQSWTTPSDIADHNPLDADRRLVTDRMMLDLLSVQSGLHREYVFDVADPLSAQGELVLRLNRDRQTPKGTRVETRLNGVSLGEAQVRGRRMTVAYPIAEGLLTGRENRLELITTDPDARPHCNASDPFIAIADGSELRIASEIPTPETDLSRFAATGSIFAEDNGADSLLVLPERDKDYTSALRLVAKLAKTNGKGWTEARFLRGDADETEANLLFIEPHSGIERSVRLNAPIAVQSAWRTDSAADSNSSGFEQFASLDGAQAMRQAAQIIWTENPLGAGGVAALYPDETGRMIAVISNTSGIGFNDALTPLVDGTHWNGLKGGVAHWNEETVMMTQAAFPLPAFETDTIVEPKADVSWTQRAKAVASILSEVNWPEAKPAALGAWLDTRWQQFSTSIRTKAASPEVQKVKTTMAEKIHSVPGAAREALDSDGVKSLRQETLAGWSNQRAQITTVAANWRRDLWTHLDIENPELKSAGIGQMQVLPIALGVSLGFLMILVGLAFAAPRSR